ncbi:MAG: hypothetical protein QM496_19915 [Verrucomicrobiota bacterium]
MKKLILWIALFALVKGAVASDFDRGGVSVDFLASQQNRSTAVSKKVLFREDFKKIDVKTDLPLGWRRGFNLFSVHPEERKLLKERIEPLTSQKVSIEEGKSFFTLATEAKAQAVRVQYSKETSKFKPDFCGSIKRWVVLPEPYQERKLRIRFRYRGVIAEGVKGENRLLIQSMVTDRLKSPSGGKQVGYKQAWFSRMNGHWQEGEMFVLCSAEAKSVAFYLKNYGCLTVDIEGLVIDEVEQEDSGLSTYLTPQFFADHLYCMAEGEPAILKFTQLNEANVEINQPVMVLELPPGIEVIDARTQLTLLEKKTLSSERGDRLRYRYALNGLKKYIQNDKLNHYTASYLMLSSSLPVGETLHSARYWIEDGEYRSKAKSFHFKIIESENAPAPVDFVSGAVVSREYDIRSLANQQSLVDVYVDKGFNAIHIGNAPSELMARLGDKGVKRYVQPAWLVNGYRIGKRDKPDEVRFQLVDGAYDEQAICPVAVYRPQEYFREQVEAPLRKLLVTDRVADGIMPNWEPYMYKFKGCFCPLCKQEFIVHSKLPAKQIESEWPKGIVEKYRGQWIKFRAWQHGLMMETLEKTVQRVGNEAGLAAHFIPEIATLSLTEEGRSHFEQVDPLEYIDRLKMIEPWGPYVDNYQYPGSYFYQTGAHLIMEAKTREVVDYIKMHITDEKKRPQLIGFPHASQGGFGMAEPEGIAFDTLCLYVNGWQGSLAYHFPDGFDARYWNALAKANRSISRFEDLVMKGDTQVRHSFKIATALPKLAPSGGRYYQVDAESSLIFSREFSLKQQRLVVIANAWKYGDAFVHLSFEGLPEGESFVLREPLSQRCFANDKGQVELSVEDLKQGVLLHVGALRFGFFLLEPYQKGEDYGLMIKPSQMQAMLSSFRPAILKAIEFEKSYHGENE